MSNIDALVGLLSQINQLYLLSMSLKSAEVLKLATKDSVKGRALLLMAYGVYHLPVEGLEKFKQ
jgi:hypothetical protein